MNKHLDPNQRAINFFGDVLKDFADKIRGGEEPSIDIRINGIRLQIQLMEVPGEFERQIVELEVK